MVFESLVADVLNRILGNYVENLDGKQLSIGIWGGDVVLQDLILKQSALDDLDLPIQIVYGRLGKLVLKIPWKNLYGSPVEAVIERLYLLSVPSQEMKYDPVKEEANIQYAKQADLIRIENAKRKAADQGKTKADDTFVEKLTTQIIKNVQVKIKDIHIRYEDTVTNPGKSFAFGVTLSNLSVESTNDLWEPAVVTETIAKIFKVLNLNALSVYWNCNCPMYSKLSIVDILKYFEEGIATKDTKPANYMYILGPINSSARLRLNPKPENDDLPFSVSKVLLNFEMEKLGIGLTKSQYQDIMLLMDSMGRMSRGLPYRKYRPFVKSYKGHYKEWWKFAYTCILEEQVRRRRRNWNWEHISQHRTFCKQYAEAYQSKLQNKKISNDIEAKITECETSLDLINLVIIRQRIELEVKRLEKKTGEREKKISWFRSWWSKPANDEDEELQATAHIMTKFEEAMTSEEKAKLYQAIDYQENIAPAAYPETFIAISCAFVLRCLELEIQDESLTTPYVLCTELKGVNCRLDQRPAANSVRIAIKIDQFTVFGLQQTGIIPQLVSSEDFSEGGVLLDVLFETNPLDRTCGQRLHVKSLPLKVIYDAQTIIHIADIFKTPQSLILEELQEAAENKLADFKEMSATGLQYAVEQHSILDLDIYLSAPYIIVPYGGLYNSEKTVLVFNLGNVKMKSVVRDTDQINIRKMHREGTNETEILKEIMSHSYDKFILELSDMQVIIANKEEKWRNCILENIISPMHLIQPINLNVNINKCLILDDPRLPKLKIAGELPSITLNISDDRLLSLLNLISSIPLPGSECELEEEYILSRVSSRSSIQSVSVKAPKLPQKPKIDIDNFVQATDMDIKFEMKELLLTVSKKNENTEITEKLLQFRCMLLELDMIRQTFNTDISIRLGGIGLTQFRVLNQLQIINTPMTTGQNEYLFTVQLSQVNKKSPEFHSKYGSCEQRLQLNFTSLQLQLHQEGLQEILKLSSDFQTTMAEVNRSNLSPESVSKIATTSSGYANVKKLATITEESISLKSPQQRLRKKAVVETISFKLIANLEELDILMANDNRQLASFAIRGINTEIIVKKSYTQVQAILRDIIVLDLNPKSVHVKILSRMDTENAINAQLVMYNIDKITEYNKNAMSVVVSMGCLKIVFLNLFVSTILDFLNKFQAAQQAILEASAAAAETTKQHMQSAYDNATRIDMKIKLKAPNIIVPRNSNSYDAIQLDLGHIEITNNFTTLEAFYELGHPAVIDELKLNFIDIKLSRILLNTEMVKIGECMLLKPLSVVIKVKRNLSASWYNNIPDLDIAGEMKSMEIMISEIDYAKIMQTLNENLGENIDEIQSEIKQQKHESVSAISVRVGNESIKNITDENKDGTLCSDKQSHIFLRFTFTMGNLIINLYKGGIDLCTEGRNHLPKNGLARFTLLVLSLKGRILTDNSISTSILLVDCLLDDIRDGREGKLTRLMERKIDQDITALNSNTLHQTMESFTKSMIDITFQQKENDTFVDVRIYSFNLILSIDYLMQIAAFFSPPKLAENPTKTTTKQTTKQTSKTFAATTTAKQMISEACITLNLKVERPDIILVERMDDINTSALILNNEVLLNIRMVGANQCIRGSISDLQLYTCCYNPEKRDETKCPVLRPCNITIVGATPRNQGLHLDISVSNVRLSVSPVIIDLLSQIQQTMYASDAAKSSESSTISYYSDIWKMKQFNDSDYWFLKTEEGQDAVEVMGSQASNFKDDRPNALKEICNLSAFSIVVTVEAGVGNKTFPMLLLETSFVANVNDWSSKLYVAATLTMQMAYYNNRLAVWEPFIEPVEIIQNNTTIHTPWELKIEMRKNEIDDQYMMSSVSEPSDIEEISFTQPTVSVTVSSNVNLELVVTKTLLEVVSNLGKAFASVVQKGIPIKETTKAPYRVINDSGLKITVLLEDSVFRLYNRENVLNYKEIVLESGAEVQLDLNVNDEANASLHLIKSISNYSLLHQTEDKNLIISVDDVSGCTLTLPVVRADKRYFSLNFRGENNDIWGLISDVTVEGAETIITLRSILQVYNHFNQSVNVYYMTNRGNELEIIKQIPPNTSCNLPMNAIYTLTNELFFSVQGHSVTAAPYIWKDLQHNLCMAKTLFCPSGNKHGNQPFVMNVCGDIEQIYFENTIKHTMASTCYNIHLRPAVTFTNCLPIPVLCIVQGDTNEFTVKPGEQLHLPTINPGNSYFVLRLEDYLDKDWCCRHDVQLNPPEFAVWEFDSRDSVAKMALDLGMHCLNKNGTMVLSLYCPFWMLNKTGLMLSYRKSSKSDKSQHGSPAKNSDDNVNVLNHPEDYSHAILFSFSAKNFFGKKKAAIRIGSGEWSDKFSLDVAGSSGTVVCKANNLFHQIGVHNQLTYNGLTKQVTFTSYFVLINNTGFVIECQELERPADQWITVQSNSCTPLWPRSERDDKLIKIKVHGTNEISAPFLITEVHTTLLKLDNKYGGVNVDVQVTEGGIFITFTQYQHGLAPALIINYTNVDIKIWEKESFNIKVLPPRNILLHTWENPTGPRLLVWETEKKQELEDDLRKDGLGEFILGDNLIIYWVSFLDGMQRVLLFTEDMTIARDAQSAGDLENIDREITVSIHGLGVSLVNNYIRQEILYIGIASSGIIWETCKLSSKRYKQLSVKECYIIENAYQNFIRNEIYDVGPVIIDQKTEVDFHNELMLRPHKRRLRRAFQTGLWFQMKTSPNQMQLHAKINRVQIDNQMYDCIFPVILAPVPPPKSVAADSALKPFAELSIVQRIMKHSTVQQYKYFKILIQEFHVKVDLGFVNAIMALFEAEELSEQDKAELFVKDMSLANEPLMALVSTQSLQEQKNFYDLLHFSPLKIHVSFSLAAPPSSNSAATTTATAQSSTPTFLNVLLQGLGVTLTDMNDVVFRLAYFERDYSFLTQKQLTSEVSSHYVGQAVKQLYVLVLGLDVIGNPYGLVLGISKGVEDLFYEPFQGAIQGPGEFAEGLVLGVRSLFGHTVGGAAGAVSRITGAMGKGIAVLTFDKDYQRKRRDQINKKPANIQEGIARGGKGLVMGVVDGVTGVFTKPISGAKEQGVEGFFKGLGKGAVGLVTRPTAGVIDFASGSLDAVKRVTELSDDVIRLRAPRYIRADGLVRPYIKIEAEGNKLLRELEKGKYANTDIYTYHMWIIEGKDILLLTDKRIAYVVHNDLFGGWQIEWSYTWIEIKTPVKVVDRGIQIMAGETKKKVFGLFGSTDHGKIVIITDPADRQRVKDKIEALRQSI